MYTKGAVASVGFIPTFAAARPVQHHAMVLNREIPQEFVARFPDFLPHGGKNGRLSGQGEVRRGVALLNATPRVFVKKIYDAFAISVTVTVTYIYLLCSASDLFAASEVVPPRRKPFSPM